MNQQTVEVSGMSTRPLLTRYAVAQERRDETPDSAYDYEQEMHDLGGQGGSIWATGSLMTKADIDPTQDEQTDR